MINVYVDGSWKPRYPDYSGWAYVITDENDNEIYSENGIVECKSRQVDGELFATMKSIEFISNMRILPDKIYLYYDYAGIYNWYSGEWKTKKEVSINFVNFLKSYPEITKLITWIKVKSHSGESLGNHIADQLANNALDFLR